MLGLSQESGHSLSNISNATHEFYWIKTALLLALWSNIGPAVIISYSYPPAARLDLHALAQDAANHRGHAVFEL